MCGPHYNPVYMYIFTLLTADCSYSQACCKGRGELAQPHVGRRAARAGVSWQQARIREEAGVANSVTISNISI